MDYSKYCYVWESYSDTGTVGCLPIHYPICAVKKTISNLRVLNFRNVYLTNMLLLGYSYTRNKSCNKSAKYFYIALFPFIFVYSKGLSQTYLHLCEWVWSNNFYRSVKIYNMFENSVQLFIIFFSSNEI